MKGKKEKREKGGRGRKNGGLGIVKSVPMYLPLHIADVAPVVKTGSVKGTDEREGKEKERERGRRRSHGLRSLASVRVEEEWIPRG